jgi:hypothetical protein
MLKKHFVAQTPVREKNSPETLEKWYNERYKKSDNVREYHILLTSNTQMLKGASPRPGVFIGEVVSVWEKHSPESLQSRLQSLSDTHKVGLDEITVE